MTAWRILLLGGSVLFILWAASMLGVGGLLVWCLAVALASAVFVRAVLLMCRRRRWSRYGPELRFAVSVLLSRNKWADLAKILGLSVDADLRLSRSARLAASALGRARADRRSVRYIPVIDGIRSVPYGLAVRVRGAPGQSLESWHNHCGQLSSALRVSQVAVAEPRPGVFELALRVRDPLGTPMVLSSPQTARGWDIPLGVDEYGSAVAGGCRNVSGVVVGGVPGAGKSAWLAFALASLAHRDDVQWLLIDGKQGYDLESLASRAYRYVSGDEAGNLEVVRDALRDVQVLMRERLKNAPELYGHSNLWSAGPSRLHPIVVVVVDECQTYLDARSLPTKEAKAFGAEIDSLIRDLVKRGRSAGIVVVLSTQRPTADSIPTSTRDNCGLRVCFSVRTREAAVAVLGDFSADAAISPINAPVGVGVSSVDGVEVRFRSPFAPDDVLRRHIADFADLTANPVDLLCDSLMEFVAEVEGSPVELPEQQHDSGTSRHRPARESSK